MDDTLHTALMITHGYNTYGRVQGVFGAEAQRYKQTCADTTYVAPEYLAERALPIFRRIGRPLEILDIGCGTGESGIFYIQEGHAVDGIDISKKMLEKAKAQGYRNLAQWCVPDTPLRLFDQMNIMMQLFLSVH